MRYAAALIVATVLVIPGCGQREGAREVAGEDVPRVPVKILGELTFPWLARGHGTKEQRVFRTRDEMLRVWRADGEAEAPSFPGLRGVERFRREPLPWWTPPGDPYSAEEREVDFDRHMVVAVFKGTGTDHDGIQIEGVFKVGDKVLVEYREFRAKQGGSVVFCCPCHVVVVEKLAGEVEFKLLPYPEVQHQPIP